MACKRFDQTCKEACKEAYQMVNGRRATASACGYPAPTTPDTDTFYSDEDAPTGAEAPLAGPGGAGAPTPGSDCSRAP